MKKEYIVKLTIPKARLEKDDKELKEVEKRLGIEAITEKDMYAFAMCGAIPEEYLLLSPSEASFGPGMEFIIYSFRVTDLVEQEHLETTKEILDTIEERLGDLISYERDMSKGIVKGIKPYKVTATDVPVAFSIIRHDPELTEQLEKQGFFKSQGIEYAD